MAIMYKYTKEELSLLTKVTVTNSVTKEEFSFYEIHGIPICEKQIMIKPSEIEDNGEVDNESNKKRG